MHLVQPLSDPADRIEITYTCPTDHEFTRVFAADASVPAAWDCPHCGRNASCGFTQSSETPVDDGPRTHWDMVLERRTTEELAEMLAERVAQMRQN